jgi:ABC-type glycerol-3-phosphate transport system permease component
MSVRKATLPFERTQRFNITRRRRRTLRHALIHIVLLCAVAVMFVPLAWMVSTSLKPVSDIYLFPPKWIPDPPQWQNYAQAVTAIPFLRYFFNTLLITGLDIIGKVFSVTLVAFAFARLRWWGRDTLFLAMLATLMLPPQVTLIPQFILFKNLGWVDTFLPLIVPNFFGGPFLTFLVRQFFMTIPRELDAAARIDGCSSFGVYWRIIMPQSAPAIIAVVILVFNNTWNDFLAPLIYLQSRDNFTLALGLRMFQGEASTSWHLLMAASLLTMLPVLVIFFTAQRYFLQGVVFTGVKA